MGLFTKRRFLLILIIAVILVGGGVGGYIFYNEVLAPEKSINVDQTLLQIDDYLQTGYYSNAEDLLMQFRSFSGGVNSWLRILDRAYTLSENTNDYTILNTLSQIATENISGSEVLWYIRIVAELELKQYEQAYSHAVKYLTNENYPSLITEASLYYTGKKPVSAPDTYSGMLAGFSEKKVDTFIDAGRMTGDDTFMLLAAVLAMHYGERDRSLSLIRETAVGISPLAHYFIAYDAGDLEYAEKLLPEIRNDETVDSNEWLMLAADLAMQKEQFSKAKNFYTEITESSPTESWIPYLNLAWIAENRMNGDSLPYLLEAYNRFPDKKSVILPLAWYFTEQENSEAALERIARYRSDHPEDPDIELLYMTLSSTVNNPAKYKAALWQLYNRYPENINIAQYLSWYLLGLEDFEELTTLLDQFERNMGEMEWATFFRAAVHTLNGAYESAEASFKESLTFVPRWETRYNLGLIYLKQGFIDDALNQFKQAEDLLTRALREQDPLGPDKKEANLYIKIALSHYLNGDYSMAKRQLNYGLEIDPHNLEGRLLLKKLEAAEKR